MGEQIGDKSIRLRIAEERRNAGDPGAVGGQRMGLPVVDHLQPMLEAA